jgi:phosphatidate cytidylyltransferase
MNKYLWLAGGVVAILLVASLVGFLLLRKLGPANATVTNLNARIRAWWVMVGIFFGAAWLGQTVTVLLFALTSFLALREFITLTPTKPGDHRALSISFFVLLPVQYGLVHEHWYGVFSIFLPVYGFLLLPSLSVLAQDTEDFLLRAAKIQWGVMICVYCISHAPALLMLQIPGYEGQNALLLFYLLFVVQISDVMQYVFGKLFGNRKIAPIVSPSKTVEGLVGGALSATVFGAAMWWITPFTPLQSAGMAAAIVVMGFLGGLVLSAVKRSMGAKDWGTMIEGHGGTLDRMDSVCFAAPVFFHLTRYFFTS